MGIKDKRIFVVSEHKKGIYFLITRNGCTSDYTYPLTRFHRNLSKMQGYLPALHTLLNIMHQGIFELWLHWVLEILSLAHRRAMTGGKHCPVLLVAALTAALNSSRPRKNPGRTKHQMVMISHVHLHPPYTVKQFITAGQIYATDLSSKSAFLSFVSRLMSGCQLDLLRYILTHKLLVYWICFSTLELLHCSEVYLKSTLMVQRISQSSFITLGCKLSGPVN